MYSEDDAAAEEVLTAAVTLELVVAVARRWLLALRLAFRPPCSKKTEAEVATVATDGAIWWETKCAAGALPRRSAATVIIGAASGTKSPLRRRCWLWDDELPRLPPREGPSKAVGSAVRVSASP